MGAYLDKELLNRTLEIAGRHKINKFIETGTSDGYSTYLLQPYFKQIDTIEIVPETYELARQTLKQYPNIRQHLGNSPEVLDKIITPGQSDFIIFLDAHWDEYWPIKDELKVLAKNEVTVPIIIHDFFVPDFKNPYVAKYSYDAYKGHPLNNDYIEEELIDIFGSLFVWYYNVNPSSENSGILFVEPLLEFTS